MGVIVPTLAVPRQTFTIDLADQATRLNIYQLRYGLFVDVLLDEALVIGGVICLNRTLIVRNTYLGYTGDFAFADTQGSDDPVYSGLGDRFKLVYLSPAEAVPRHWPIGAPVA